MWFTRPVATTPEFKFAKAAGSTIAYMDYGDGPVTICAVPPMAQNIELAWESPVFRAMFERLGSFSRQIAFDKRGTGMSDRSLDIPSLDERVDELSAVMDHAGVDRSFVFGLSEGGPMAIMFAATYPERVEGLILEGTAASLVSDEQRAMLADPEYVEERKIRNQAFVEAWGTDESITLGIFGPTLAANDPEFAAWWPRYERNSANRDAILDLFRMNAEMDARDVIPRVECPVLILHRTGDRVASVEQARDTYRRFEDAGADVRMVEFPGDDHFTFSGDMDPPIDELEKFTTGRIRDRAPLRRHDVSISTMGRFEVVVDGEPVPTSGWGSKRARTLLKRLIVARGWPVTRDELFEVLWPGEASERLGARLSVQLSAVRRILRGGVIADRSSIRLDLHHVEVDVEQWFALDDADAIVERYQELLPDDRYDDWSGPLRDEMRDRFVATAHDLIRGGEVDDGPALLRRLIEIDPYDEVAHRELVRHLHAAGRHGDAATAHQRYAQAMGELGVVADEWETVVS